VLTCSRASRGNESSRASPLYFSDHKIVTSDHKTADPNRRSSPPSSSQGRCKFRGESCSLGLTPSPRPQETPWTRAFGLGCASCGAQPTKFTAPERGTESPPMATDPLSATPLPRADCQGTRNQNHPAAFFGPGTTPLPKASTATASGHTEDPLALDLHLRTLPPPHLLHPPSK